MKKNSLLSVLLCLPVCFLGVSCKGKNDSSDLFVRVSCLDSNVKILQNEEFNGGEERLSVFASIGEYEAGQILIQPTQNIKSYELTLGDLVSEDGTTYKKENITVYNQKYIDCETKYYPDALLPFNVAKSYGENTVKANENQTLYVEFKIPYEQAAGVYTGDFTLTMDSKTVSVPVEVEVFDFEMSKDVHLKSYYNTRLHYSSPGELTGKRSMQQKYYEKLLDFRLTSPTLLADANATFSDKIKKIQEYSSSEREARLSTICLSMTQKGSSFNTDELEEQIKMLVEVSLEDNVNYLDKVILRPGFLDEPFMTLSKVPTINKVLPIYYEWREAVAQTIANDDSLQGAFKEEIVQSIRKIPCLITTYVMEALADTIKNYCVPAPQAFESAYSRSQYQELAKATGESQWMYSCGDEYPGYRIDATVMNLRAMPWMCYEAGYEGTLNWENTLYTTYIGDKANPYEVSMRSADTHGDGYLFYPGRLYGLEEPVTSVRLHALRDGYEDYEWLYLLNELYTKEGYSADGILSLLYPRVFNDNKGTDNLAGFSDTRYALGKLVELAKDGVFITDVKEFVEKYNFTITSKDNALKSVNGNVVAEADSSFDFEKTASNTCKAVIESKNGTCATIALCGKVESYQTFTDESIGSACSVDSGTIAMGEIEGEKTLKLTLENARTFTMPVEATAINKNLDSLKIHIYSDIEKPCAVNVYFVGSAGQTIVKDFIVKKGWNMLTLIDLPNAKWGLIKKIEKLKIEFIEETSGNIYINDVSTVKGG